MNDAKGPMAAAALLTAAYVILVWSSIGPTIRMYMRYFISGPLVCRGCGHLSLQEILRRPAEQNGIPVVAGFALLIGGVFLTIFVPTLVLWRGIKLRRAGMVLQRAHGEVRRGMPGMEELGGRIR